MKKPDRGPDYKEPHYPAGRNDLPPIWLREIKRKDLKKDPYRVRLMYKKPDGTEGSHDALNWIAARAYARKLNKELEEGRAVGTGGMKFERVWNEWFEKRDTDVQLGELRPSTVRGDRFLAVHVLGEFGKKRLDKILSIDVENWAKAQMIEKGWTVSYADRSVLKDVPGFGLRCPQEIPGFQSASPGSGPAPEAAGRSPMGSAVGPNGSLDRGRNRAQATRKMQSHRVGQSEDGDRAQCRHKSALRRVACAEMG